LARLARRGSNGLAAAIAPNAASTVDGLLASCARQQPQRTQKLKLPGRIDVRMLLIYTIEDICLFHKQ
jgi:hypothetical protein